jgi:hypothetical protein
VCYAENGTAELIVGRFGEDEDEGDAWENPKMWTCPVPELSEGLNAAIQYTVRVEGEHLVLSAGELSVEYYEKGNPVAVAQTRPVSGGLSCLFTRPKRLLRVKVFFLLILWQFVSTCLCIATTRNNIPSVLTRYPQIAITSISRQPNVPPVI